MISIIEIISQITLVPLYCFLAVTGAVYMRSAVKLSVLLPRQRPLQVVLASLMSGLHDYQAKT